MTKVKSTRSHFIHLVRVLTISTLISNQFAWATATSTQNDEETFVFAGTCPNGKAYRLVSYQRDLSGKTHSYYDYEGPVGTGTVQSNAHPKVMAVRICRQLAEIINTNYWE